MADGVDIPLESMQQLSEALGAIMKEFEESGAGARTGKLVDAIDEPMGDSRLARAAEEFESAWDDKRETLRQDLEEMKKRIDEAKDGWREADLELAKSMESKK